MDNDYTKDWASLAPRGGTDSFGTPPGRSMTDRFHEKLDTLIDIDRNREPLTYAYPIKGAEVQTKWQMALFVLIIVTVIVGLIFF